MNLLIKSRGTGVRARIGKIVFSWVRILAIATALALFISFFVIANAAVASGSMEDTIMTGERVICNRLAFTFANPQRFDVVLFELEHDDRTVAYVKRIIGLPGERVEIIGGQVFIDHSTAPLDDSFTREPARGNYGPFYVPEDHYFVLGDNRNNSFDSKSWDDPFIPRTAFMGRAIFTYYPRFIWHNYQPPS